MLSYARLPPQHCADAISHMERAVRAVTAEEPSRSSPAIRAEEQRWHLDWPTGRLAAPDDFYPVTSPACFQASATAVQAAIGAVPRRAVYWFTFPVWGHRIAWVQPLPLSQRLSDRFLRRVRNLPPDAQALVLLAAADVTGERSRLWRAGSAARPASCSAVYSAPSSASASGLL